MGREVKTFRQTKKSGSSDTNNRNYAKINRSGSWSKLINIFKKGDK